MIFQKKVGLLTLPALLFSAQVFAQFEPSDPNAPNTFQYSADLSCNTLVTTTGFTPGQTTKVALCAMGKASPNLVCGLTWEPVAADVTTAAAGLQVTGQTFYQGMIQANPGLTYPFTLVAQGSGDQIVNFGTGYSNNQAPVAGGTYFPIQILSVQIPANASSTATYTMSVWTQTSSTNAFLPFNASTDNGETGPNGETPYCGNNTGFTDTTGTVVPSFVFKNSSGGPNVSVAVTAPPSMEVGTPANYAFTVTNNGTTPATGVTVSDTIPADLNYTGFTGTNWSCTPVSGQGPITVTCTYSNSTGIAPNGGTDTALTINVTPTVAGTVTNYASTDSTGGTNPPVPTTCATANPPLGCAAAVTTQLVAAATNSLTATTTTSTLTPAPGTTVTVTGTCTNTGTAAETNVACSINGAPAGATVICNPANPQASLAPGASITCTDTFTIPTGSTTPITITTTPSSSSGGTVTPSSLTLTPTVPQNSADMAAIGAAMQTAKINTPVTLIATCQNNGPDAATNANCSVSGVPAVAMSTVCSPTVPVASLPSGASITCTTTFTPSQPGTYTFTTTASSTSTDPTVQNNAAQGTVTVEDNGGGATVMQAPVNSVWMLLTLGLILAGVGAAGLQPGRQS